MLNSFVYETLFKHLLPSYTPHEPIAAIKQNHPLTMCWKNHWEYSCGCLQAREFVPCREWRIAEKKYDADVELEDYEGDCETGLRYFHVSRKCEKCEAREKASSGDTGMLTGKSSRVGTAEDYELGK